MGRRPLCHRLGALAAATHLTGRKQVSKRSTHARLGMHISLGRWGTCQHGAFSGVGAIVASFVPAECPKGGGMWGIFGKPLKRAFRRCMG